MFLDWMIQPENLFYLQNGVEGETYTLDADGLAILDSEYSGEAKLFTEQQQRLLVHRSGNCTL